MIKKLNKKNKINTFLIILFFIIGFLQAIDLYQKNRILSDKNSFQEENANNIKITTKVESDWEIARGSGTLATISKPFDTQKGDLLILHCTTNGHGSLNGPIGWNILLPETQSGQQTTASWYKIAGFSEPISYSVNWTGDEGYMAGIIRITGHNSTNPIQTTAVDTGNGDIINPSVTTTKDYTLLIGFHGMDDAKAGDDYGNLLVETEPTVLYAKISTGLEDPCSAGMYYELQKSKGTTPTRTWDFTFTEGWYAATVAINLKVPIINIVSPIENEAFGVVAPNFSVEVIDPNLDSMWYTLDEGLNNYTFTNNETINQAAWDALPDGFVTIRFYANNTLGDINFNQVNVIKDTSVPTINIVSPIENEIFGVDPPSFIIEIADPNLDTIWYSIFNSTDKTLNITFIGNETIDPTEWGKLYDGIYTLRFFANDTLGNINFEDVDIIKEIYAIIINITSPTENEIFGVAAPSFVVEITDTDINTTWYTVDGGLNNYTFTDNGTINQVAWDAFPDGIVTIRFYANNTSGKIYFRQVNVIKDSSAPIINIITPIANEEFGVNPPSFVVEITDPNLDTMWYSIFNNSHFSLNITFTDNGTIDLVEWDKLYDGTYTLRFYANNTLGNINFNEVDVIKNIYAIIINIISPTENEVFGINAPSFIVEITSAFLNTTWYTLDGAPEKYIFTVNGTINQTAWSTLPDGIVSIRFYANNSLGEIIFEQVNVIKDTSAPNINIVNPLEDEVFSVDPPDFIVEIADPNLDTMWYWIFNNTHDSLNITFTDNGTIDPTEWDALYDGTYTIRFYANDTVGNINFEEVNVTKDIYAIFINIINPIENEIFGVDAPSFIVEITCAFLNVTWYTVDGGLNNYTFTDNETINQVAWDALSDGVVTITFYANNTLGDINFEQVNIVKDSSPPIINIVSPTENEIFGVDAPSFSVEITDPNLDTMWYTVNNSATKFTFTQDGLIDQTIWDAQVDGDIILIFYANDTLGNLASEDIIIRKSTPSGAGPDIIPIIILVSIIGGVAAAGVILGILIKQGKISLEKLTKRKPSTEKIKPEKPPKEKVKKEKIKPEKVPKEKTKTDETLTEENNK